MTDKVVPGSTPCLGHQQLVGPSGSALVYPAAAVWALVKARASGAGIYINIDGLNAAASTDMAVDAGAAVEITANLALVTITQQAATATVDIWYFG